MVHPVFVRAHFFETGDSVLKPALLALQDGTVFKGRSIGADGISAGEVVFNTAMTGYQEILTDPSYCQQLITLTYPHIGNTGINSEDEEATRIHASGLIIRDLPLLASNWRSQGSLQDYLESRGVVAISDIDTRKLTRLLRDKGAQSGAIMAGEEVSEDAAIEAARGFGGLEGCDLAQVVTTDESYSWTQSSWSLEAGYGESPDSDYHVVAYDYGVKKNILCMLVDRGARVTVVPAKTPAGEVIAMKPDGVFLSNGPGDPEPCDYAIKAITEILQTGLPVFGICLGHQLLALASGASSVKMKFGHHGANHPVQDLASGVVMITSQNHGFAVDETSLPDNLKATHRSLFDGSLQAVERTDRPAFSFQGHPEASPGPHDVAPMFDRFFELIAVSRARAGGV
jgi:carbamoyl-phosphate synthase small subunit